MKSSKWLRSKLTRYKKPKKTPASWNDLPGELRNRIYEYALFPYTINIPTAVPIKLHHLAAQLLSSPLFRTNRQVRLEAMSYLCANFSPTFFGLENANLFFACVGEAVKEVKSFAVWAMLTMSELPDTEEGRERMEVFWGYVGKMKGLRRLDITTSGADKVGGVLREFMKRMEELQERGVEVKLSFGVERVVWGY